MAQSNIAWNAIFNKYFRDHDFSVAPAVLTADMIKDATRKFKETKDRETRILAKVDSREDLPQVLKDNGLFMLPTRNGEYIIIRGEGFINLPEITGEEQEYTSKLDFPLDTSLVGNSEMQHLDYAYAISIIRTFVNDPTLILTIRGRKYTPKFSFKVGEFSVDVDGVQTEVDAGYEGKNQVVLVEAKNSKTTNTIIRQLFYPFRQWQGFTSKEVVTVFFEKRGPVYSLWQFGFKDPNNYNSIALLKSKKYKII